MWRIFLRSEVWIFPTRAYGAEGLADILAPPSSSFLLLCPALLDKYGAAELRRYLDEMLRYTERRAAAAFAQFPDGTFSAESSMDGDGAGGEPIRLAATVHVADGNIRVDLTGCDAQRPSPTNATYAQTYSGVV